MFLVYVYDVFGVCVRLMTALAYTVWMIYTVTGKYPIACLIYCLIYKKLTHFHWLCYFVVWYTASVYLLFCKHYRWSCRWNEHGWNLCIKIKNWHAFYWYRIKLFGYGSGLCILANIQKLQAPMSILRKCRSYHQVFIFIKIWKNQSNEE